MTSKSDKLINHPQMKTKHRLILISVLVFLIAVAAAIYLNWPSLTNYAVYKSDIRQSPHWAAYHQTSFQDDDLLLRYAQFNESPLQNLIYYGGTYFIEMVTLTKIFTVISYGFAALLFFLIGQSLYGLRTGLLIALFFTFFPGQFEYSIGFFSKFWITPLIMVALWSLQKQRWRDFLFLLPFAAVAYPPAVVLLGVFGGMFALLTFPAARRTALILVKNLVIGSITALSLLLVKYLWPPDGIGPMVPGSVLQGMPEMIAGGLNWDPYLPVPSIFSELWQRLNHPYVILATVIYFIFLRRRVVWNRTMTALFLAAVGTYLLADLFFMQLYIPNRYTRHALVVLLIVWNARNIDRLIDQIPGLRLKSIALATIILLTGIVYFGDFVESENSLDRRRYDPMCQFIRQLPDKALIAGPPFYMDNVTVQGKHSVLCNFKLAHPWFTDYYNEIKERTRATFRAIYATDKAAVNALHEIYGVDYFVIGLSYYNRGRLRKGQIYVNPYNDYISELTLERTGFILKYPPVEAVVYRDSRYMVVKLPI